MPNWCNNTLHVIGPKEEKERFARIAAKKHDYGKDAEPTNFNLHALLLEAGIKKERVERCVWAFYGERINYKDSRLFYTYQSKWCPPIEALAKISEAFPRLRFKIYYDEPGNQFRGKGDIQAGEVLKHEETNY